MREDEVFDLSVWRICCGDPNKRCIPTRLEKYWTESERGDGQWEDHQSYPRQDMMGKARGKQEVMAIPDGKSQKKKRQNGRCGYRRNGSWKHMAQNGRCEYR